MNPQNPYLPVNEQDIDNIQTEDTYKLERPCKHHKIAFPSNDIKKYPEITNMSYFLCPMCGWYVCNNNSSSFENGGYL